MITEEQLTGNWNQLKGRIRERWGQLTDDELHEVEGELGQLVGLIQQKTGQTKMEIERTLTELTEECGGRLSEASAAAQQYVDQASHAVGEMADQVRQNAAENLAEAQELVRRRPAESIVVAFGTGLIAGLIVGLVSRTR